MSHPSFPAIPAVALPAAHPVATGDWTPLDFRRLLFHFRISRSYERMTDYIAMQTDLLPDERIILFFLHAIYEDSQATIELYGRYIVALGNHARKSCLHIRRQDVDAFIRHYLINGAKPATINTICGALKSYFRHLVDSGLLEMNPTAFLKRRRRNAGQSLPGHLAHSLGEAELHRLFEGMVSANAPARDVALFKTLFMTGLRAEEAVSLTWENLVEWQGNSYLDVFGKGSKTRRVYLPLAARNALSELRAKTSPLPSHPIFASLRRPGCRISRHGLYALVKKWSKRVIRRRDVSPHWFRHSCFTQLASRGASLESIKALAGHESIETTMRYNEAAQLMKPAGMIFDRI